MNILVVTLNVPRPSWGAGTRNYQLLRALGQRHRVSLFALAEDAQAGERDAESLRAFTRAVHVVPVPAIQRKRLQQLLCVARGRSYWLTAYCPPAAGAALAALCQREHFDAVVFESVLVAGYATPPGARVIIDQHNIEHELVWRTYEQETSRLRKWYSRMEYTQLKKGELDRCRRADAILVTSERERLLLGKLLPESVIAVAPNGVDLAAFSAAPPNGSVTDEVADRIVFTGTLGYYPNEQAVLHFAERCWPLIREQIPRATWQIVGSNPPDSVRQLGALPGVTVTGTVPSVQPYLAAASVAVVPLLVGSGTRLKILEALAMRKAIVTTSLGCEGIALTAGQHALIADEPDAFAAAVAQLLREPETRAALGAAGRALVEEQYSWDRCSEPLVRVLEEAN